jgi:hypothetical protein
MKLRDHCIESEQLFGKRYEEIHQWLDEFAGSEKYGMKHRRVRHHEAGICKAVELFGPDVEQAARQHIISDLKEEGWHENDPFPNDEKDYVRMGFY